MRVIKNGNDKKIERFERKKRVTGKCSVCGAKLLLEEQDMYSGEPLWFPIRKFDVFGYRDDGFQYGRILETICPYCGEKVTIKTYFKKRNRIYDNKLLQLISSHGDTVIWGGLLIGFWISMVIFISWGVTQSENEESFEISKVISIEEENYV